jgi:DNA-binding transcriptional MerR regulator
MCVQDDQDEWLTVEEAAQLLGVSTRTIMRRSKAQRVASRIEELQPTRIKPRRLYSRHDLERLKEPSSDDNV